MPERTTVRLPEDLLIRAKQKAAAENRTLTSLIEEGLRTVLAASNTKKKRVRPRVSAARGSQVVDLPPYRDIQEADDIEYMRRNLSRE
jgi:hypothetical protein